MEQDRLKFAKRKLRVQRCKTLPGAKHKIQVKSQTKPSLTTSSRSSTHRPFNESVSTPIPKGDPSLGTKISHLSKDERKQVKAGDTDRVARRLAKKKMAKAKMSLVEKGVKGRDGKDRGDRERVRKTGKERQGGQGDKGKSRGRIRSGKAISKLNMKK